LVGLAHPGSTAVRRQRDARKQESETRRNARRRRRSLRPRDRSRESGLDEAQALLRAARRCSSRMPVRRRGASGGRRFQRHGARSQHRRTGAGRRPRGAARPSAAPASTSARPCRACRVGACAPAMSWPPAGAGVLEAMKMQNPWRDRGGRAPRVVTAGDRSGRPRSSNRGCPTRRG